LSLIVARIASPGERTVLSGVELEGEVLAQGVEVDQTIQTGIIRGALVFEEHGGSKSEKDTRS
jgi:hypothetical protein